MHYLWPIAKQLVAPYFIDQDARDLETLVDGVYVHYHPARALAKAPASEHSTQQTHEIDSMGALEL
ncbi:MAG: hypothetical protein JW934_17045 [Anaerolineae bacterium]|nr:hypothetical protein [Anaerolineae bacterium]